MSLLPVDDALAQILKGVKPLGAVDVPLSNAHGRVLSGPLKAQRAQPPFAASAMDGYAVRAADIAEIPATLKVIGEAPAGHGFSGRVGKGKAVRIFTGAPMPRGADTVVIQENTETSGKDAVIVLESSTPGSFVRHAGLDFKKGETLLPRHTVLGARQIGLAAAMNHARVPVVRRPSVALLATGDELVEPGSNPRDDQIISSNALAIAAMITRHGGEPVDLGIIPDKTARIEKAIERAAGSDILVTIGGASVGDHDLVQAAMEKSGIKIGFWKIAMRPGKPLMFGKRGDQRVIGLPGNPVSAMVCTRLFILPLIAKMTGDTRSFDPVAAVLDTGMARNDQRQDYIRATLARGDKGQLVATPFPRQDSSMQRVFAEADCLVIRPPHAPAAKAGEQVQVLLLDF
ncbi:molybdopterin-binding protein [Anderseniella sp. Alg231-50]|uniref:molybdopterin-binding protein n=1 Tax=Anderseniella sp. Alg231-50 TaxID=1922226 RepID=UPI000D55D94A